MQVPVMQVIDRQLVRRIELEPLANRIGILGDIGVLQQLGGIALPRQRTHRAGEEIDIGGNFAAPGKERQILGHFIEIGIERRAGIGGGGRQALLGLAVDDAAADRISGQRQAGPGNKRDRNHHGR